MIVPYRELARSQRDQLQRCNRHLSTYSIPVRPKLTTGNLGGLYLIKALRGKEYGHLGCPLCRQQYVQLRLRSLLYLPPHKPFDPERHRLRGIGGLSQDNRFTNIVLSSGPRAPAAN